MCPALLCKRRRPRPKSGPVEDGDLSSQPGGRHQLSMVCGKSTLGSTKQWKLCSQAAFLGDLAHVIANVTSHANGHTSSSNSTRLEGSRWFMALLASAGPVSLPRPSAS